MLRLRDLREDHELKVARSIRTCFKKADSCSLFVKILAHATALTAFFALIEQESALLKIFDLKAEKFRGIFVHLFRRLADAYQEKMGEKHRNLSL